MSETGKSTDLAQWAEDLVCPVCFGALRFSEVAVECCACGRNYPVEDGIPVLIAVEGDWPAHRGAMNGAQTALMILLNTKITSELKWNLDSPDSKCRRGAWRARGSQCLLVAGMHL